MKKYKIIMIVCLQTILFSACNDFLDQEPLSDIAPEQYLTTEANIASYATNMYETLPVHGQSDWGRFQDDNNTDAMAGINPSNMYAPGYWKVGQNGGTYYFGTIYQCNYFFDKVIPLVESGSITGVETNINHYIGEVYFFRAFEYFNRLKALGDFPIVETVLPDNLEALTTASKRSPRNEVVRFILKDLDRAIELMLDNPPVGSRNRLNKDCARLFKSRVALYEGTWLKYFKGTAFVPNGSGWPGKEKDYNSNYAYPSGGIDQEIDYFLTQAMNEAKVVADKYSLVNNTGTFQNQPTDPANPYFNMFGATDMNPYPEVLLWKRYDLSLGITNNISGHASKSNAGYGTTKSMIDAFIMSNGEPIYAAGSHYPGDNNLMTITKDRDSRAQIFFKKPGDNNFHTEAGQQGVRVEPYPDVISATPNTKYTTGYAIRKGLNFDGYMSNLNYCTVGCIVFRAVEAYLNYIEACYEKTGSVDGTADRYWRAIRQRAKINEDYHYTISLTDMNKEAETDWGAYSGGQLIDATLFNIRRERRCELMAEGFRMADLKRWRSMDQMINTPYHILGMNLWENVDLSKLGNLQEGQNVSPQSFSKYLAPYHISPNNRVYDGYRWNMAHYLDPIAIQHFIITGGSDVSASPLYQNPGWPLVADDGPQF